MFSYIGVNIFRLTNIRYRQGVALRIRAGFCFVPGDDCNSSQLW